MHCVSGNEDLIEETKIEFKAKIEKLESLMDRIPLLPCSAVEDNTAPVAVPDREVSRNVFIVHGHDEGVRSQVETLVRKLGYKPIILCKQSNGGATIIEKLSENRMT